MDTKIQGYKARYEQKREIIHLRMDDSMIEEMNEIRRKTGISVSEIIREAVRRLLQEMEQTGNISLKFG